MEFRNCSSALDSVLFLMVLIGILPNRCHAFLPRSRVDLKSAVKACLNIFPKGGYFNGPHGPMAQRDVSRVTDMSYMFSGAKFFRGDISKWDVSNVRDMSGMFMGARDFNGDLSEWDVSRVTDMPGMFRNARSFDGDISRWDVATVTNMDYMFSNAVSFERKLCGPAWVHSKASKAVMFAGSSGAISRTVCTTSASFSPQSKEELKGAVDAYLDVPPGDDGCSDVSKMGSSAEKKSFWDAIGRPRLIVAPMVQQSELAFRLLTRRYGADLCYTPMYHSRLMVQSAKYREKVFNDLSSAKDRPLLVQFCGHDPKMLLIAARYVEGLCDGIDLNLGCPQDIARRGNYGAYLLENKELVLEIVRTLSSSLTVPLTCKIRLYPDIEATLKMAKDIEEAGCQMLCVHGRTKEEKKQLISETDWGAIRRIKERASIPVVANGSIGKFEDIERCLKVTQADGVMTAEAILENPAFFHSPKLSGEQPFHRQLRLTDEYLSLCEEHMPPVKTVSRHVVQFLFGGFMANKQITQRLFKSKSLADVRRSVQLLRDATDNGNLQSESPLANSVNQEGRWYGRHNKNKTTPNL